MTECPKCGKLFGVIDEQRAHVPLCNGSLTNMHDELKPNHVVETIMDLQRRVSELERIVQRANLS